MFTILVVEDEKLAGLYIEELLREFDCKYVRARHGNEVMDLVAQNAFDLVLMDLSLPGASGLELVGRIQEQGGKYASLPVVAVTAHAMEGDREKCLAAGFSDYLPKPFTEKDLLSVLYAHLGHK